MNDKWWRSLWTPAIGFAFAGYICSMFILPIFGKVPAPMSIDLLMVIGTVLGVGRYFRSRTQLEEVKKV